MNFPGVFLQRSFENPATSLSDPDAWLTDAFGGGPAESGVSVNTRSALTYAPVWRAVNLLSDGVATTPLIVYKRMSDGGKERATTHPAYPLLKIRPNPGGEDLVSPSGAITVVPGAFITRYYFKKTLHAHVLLRGNGYAHIRRTGDAKPVGLTILDPSVTYPVRRNGVLWYLTTVDSTQIRIPPEDVLHFKGLGFNGLVGLSVIEFAANTIGLGMGQTKYSSRFFRNNARPSVVLEFPSPVTKEKGKEVLRIWEEMHKGLDNAHRTALLSGGGKANPLSMNAKDSQLVESEEFGIRQIANVFGVPPHLLGDPTRTSFKSLEAEDAQFLARSLNPPLVMWEQECELKLLTETQQRNDTHFCEFTREDLIRTDTKALTESLVMEVNNGLLSPDEARAIRNRSKIPDGAGEKFRKPLNVGIIGEDEPEPAEPDADDDEGDDEDDEDGTRAAPSTEVMAAHRGLLVDGLRRMCKRLDQHAKRAKPLNAAWLRDLAEKHGEVFREALKPCIEAINVMCTGNGELTLDALASEFFRKARVELAAGRALSEALPDTLADQFIEHRYMMRPKENGESNGND